MKDEKWKPVPSLLNMYEASNLGRIRSVDREIKVGRWRGQIRVQSIGSNGYLYVNTSVNGKAKNILSHRLVAEAFFGEIPNGMEVNHIDGDRKNNKIENLELVTHSENCKHRHEVLGAPYPKPGLKGRYSRNAKPVIGKNVIDNTVIFYPYVTLAEKDGFSVTGISKCCNGNRKTSGGFSWRYATQKEVMNFTISNFFNVHKNSNFMLVALEQARLLISNLNKYNGLEKEYKAICIAEDFFLPYIENGVT